MVYTIKTKRDGQGWKETGEIWANNWQDAKRKFSENICNDLACNSDDSFSFVDNITDYNNLPDSTTKYQPFKGIGWYRVQGSGTDVLILGEGFSSYSDDVFQYTINRVPC